MVAAAASIFALSEIQRGHNCLAFATAHIDERFVPKFSGDDRGPQVGGIGAVVRDEVPESPHAALVLHPLRFSDEPVLVDCVPRNQVIRLALENESCRLGDLEMAEQKVGLHGLFLKG